MENISQKNQNKAAKKGWVMFDWANSAYALVITVAIFPAYFTGMSDAPVKLFNSEFLLESIYSFAISFAYLMIALFSPLLSGIADVRGNKLQFLRIFTTVGALSCIGLFAFKSIDNIALGIGLFILATIGFAGGIVFYNAFLPQIAEESEYDYLSAKGFSLGFLGSTILLISCLVMILNPTWFGLADSVMASRISFVLVGIWWILFAQYSFNRLPKDQLKPLTKGWLKSGYLELHKTWVKAKESKSIVRFLTAFFFLSAGVNTVILLASTFASTELNFDTPELITVVIILQIVGIAGSYLFAFLSKKMGNVKALILMLTLWIAVCVAAFYIYEKNLFYIIASFVGLLMGGTQSTTRSTYSKLIPENTEDLTSYYSFYDLLEKVSIVSGTFIFGIVSELTGGMRNSVMTLSIFFIVGIILLFTLGGINKKAATLA